MLIWYQDGLANQWKAKKLILQGKGYAEEEGRLINISLGYEILPLCMGPTKLCTNVSRQTWTFVLPPKKEIPHIAWTVYCPVLL